MKPAFLLATVLALSSAVLAADKAANPRAAAENYVAAALGGKVDDAIALAVPGQSPGKKEKIDEFRTLIAAKAVKLPTVWADAKTGRAVAVSEMVKIAQANAGTQEGCLVFALVKTGDKWLIKDIDFRTEDKANEQVDKFKTKNADAKEVPPKAGA